MLELHATSAPPSRSAASGSVKLSLFAGGICSTKGLDIPEIDTVLFCGPPRARSCSAAARAAACALLALARAASRVLDFHRPGPSPLPATTPLPPPLLGGSRRPAAPADRSRLPLPPRRLQPPARIGLHGAGAFNIGAESLPKPPASLLANAVASGPARWRAAWRGSAWSWGSFYSGGGCWAFLQRVGGGGQAAGLRGKPTADEERLGRGSPAACFISTTQAPALARLDSAMQRPLRGPSGEASILLPSRQVGMLLPSSGAMAAHVPPQRRLVRLLGRRRHSRRAGGALFAPAAGAPTDLPCAAPLAWPALPLGEPGPAACP